MLLYGHDRAVSLWVGRRAAVDDFGPCCAIGVARNGALAAGVVFSNWRNGNIEATIASDDPLWCRRAVLRGLFAYPFGQLRCRRMTCLIRADNERSLKLCKGLGFTLEGTHRSLFPDGATGLSLGMLREDCRWIAPDRRGG